MDCYFFGLKKHQQEVMAALSAGFRYLVVPMNVYGE